MGRGSREEWRIRELNNNKKKDKSEIYYEGEGIKFFEWVSGVSIMFTIIGPVVLRRRQHGEWNSEALKEKMNSKKEKKIQNTKTKRIVTQNVGGAEPRSRIINSLILVHI